MAETSSGGNEDKGIARINSFKAIRSPSRTFSKSKTSSNPLSRLNPVKLFSRKSSGKEGSESGRRTKSSEESDQSGEMNASKLVDAAKEVVNDVKAVLNEDTAIAFVKDVKDVIIEKAPQTLLQHKGDVDLAAKSLVTSSDMNDKKSSFLDKAMNRIDKSMDDLKDKAKEGMGKAKEVIDKEIRGKNKEIDDKTLINEVKALGMVDLVKEEVVAVAVVGTIQSPLTKEETSKGVKGENEKEDNCITSLAQGLQKVCAPWSVKKED